jgi:very-short-patch-repair endonuclease
MGRQTATPAAAITLAKAQHGVVALPQLYELGVTWKRLGRWVEAGWLVRVHRGVYAIEVGSWHARWQAAVFACGAGAALSHGSAAALWRIRRPREGPVDVTVIGDGGQSRRAGIAVHRSKALTTDQLRAHDGITVTPPARTLVDLAGTGVSRRDLERAVDEAERRRLCSRDVLEREVRSHPRPGCAEIRALCAHYTLGSTITRSELEERFLALCRKKGLPEPQVNVRLMGLTVDFLWPHRGVVVEVDGRTSHDTERAFQDDRDRDSLLAANGYRVLRFTWWDVTRRPAIVVDRLRRVLDQGHGGRRDGAGARAQPS